MSTKTFFYYSGDWIKGKTLILEICSESLSEADKIFEQKTGINPAKSTDITVTSGKLV